MEFLVLDIVTGELTIITSVFGTPAYIQMNLPKRFFYIGEV